MLAVDPAADRHDAAVLLVEEHLGVELFRRRAIAVDDAEEAIGVDLVFELAQQAVDREDETVRAFGAKLAQVEHRARRFDRRLHERRRQLVLREERVERRLPGHDGLNGLGLDRKDDIGTDGRPGRVELPPAGRGEQGCRDEHDGRRGNPDTSSVPNAGQCSVTPVDARSRGSTGPVQRFDTVIWMIFRNFTGRPLSVAG